ncbi:TrkH family potassium uptake protein [Williamsoniiplasma lucivorax]|uniref:Potassium uptake protein KtrB n=1 Tax=Williamsoniiplasma lucivorax TaxID=209274 RepID=A0A2S5R9Z9_9MOLU|nr:potassium transporter TrkG [Williamsoniiplasma lucivorax]PPE04151.1 potassium uptake protein KtrB [Williamsoniiplasma lucivorax]
MKTSKPSKKSKKSKNIQIDEEQHKLYKINEAEKEILHDERKSRNELLFRKLKKAWPLSKISGRIFLIYFLVVMLGGFLLSIPGVLSNTGSRYNWNFLLGVFTASSAFSDTGINILNVSADYSFWGQLITIILIEAGGIGILTFKIVLFLAIQRKISLNDTIIAKTERGSSTTSSTIEIIRDGFIWLTIVQLTAAFILFFAFFFEEPANINGVVSPYHNFSKSLWFAIYHSTSAVNNAGFDIISNASLQPYNVAGHHSYLIQIVFLLEWVIGGLGYPTFHDIRKKIKARKQGRKVPFSLFTKLNFCIYSFLFVAGPLMIFASEFANQETSFIFHPAKDNVVDPTVFKPWWESMMDIIFNTTSSRNAGFSTIPINDFNAGSKTILSILMFIGSAPSSTAGGIRTTTFAILLLATWAVVRNNNKTTAFKKTIPEDTVKRAFAVLFLSLFIVLLAVIMIFIDSWQSLKAVSDYGPESVGNATIIEILTLITSAFGTVGMNPFNTEQMLYGLGTLSKIVVIVVMFLGQLGISNTLLVFVKPSQKKNYGYLDEEVVIG